MGNLTREAASKLARLYAERRRAELAAIQAADAHEAFIREINVGIDPALPGGDRTVKSVNIPLEWRAVDGCNCAACEDIRLRGWPWREKPQPLNVADLPHFVLPPAQDLATVLKDDTCRAAIKARGYATTNGIEAALSRAEKKARAATMPEPINVADMQWGALENATKVAEMFGIDWPEASLDTKEMATADASALRASPAPTLPDADLKPALLFICDEATEIGLDLFIQTEKILRAVEKPPAAAPTPPETWRDRPSQL